MSIKKIWIVLLCACGWSSAGAQNESSSVFHFLKLPTSAHAMALGGFNVSIPDDDASLLFQNPALMANVSDKSINLSFFTYMQGCKAGNASWVMSHGERGSWGVGAQFLGYGSMREFSVEEVELGTYSALDMAISGGYTYALTEHLSGGVTGKFIYSKYGSFSAIGLAADLGVNYWNDDIGLYISAVAANLGGQVKAFGDRHERLPFDLRIGFTQQLAKAPIRISISFVDLSRWRTTDYYTAGEELSVGRIFTNHLVLGLDITPMDLFYISAGYNFRRAYELKAAGSSHAAGLTLGAGINVKKFSLGLSYAKYHVSMPAFMITAQYHL